MTEEAKVTVNGKELEVKNFSDQQKYLYNQMVDLRNKQGRLNFELDQINASLSVFENAFKESFKEETEEAETEEK
jgi:archaellum component FlaC